MFEAVSRYFVDDVYGIQRGTAEIEADSKQKAEQIVSDDWKKQVFVLGPENFVGVEFEAVPIINTISEE